MAWIVRALGVAVVLASLALLPASRASARRHAPILAQRILPGEFEPVARTLVAWPDDAELAHFVGELVAEASGVSEVVIAVNEVVDRHDIEEVLVDLGADLGAVTYLPVDYTSIWMRDFGPLAVRVGGRTDVVEFEYFGERNDDRLPAEVAQRLWSTSATELPIEFEGGNLLSNGAGICLTSDQLYAHNRGVSKRKLRSMFRRSFGCTELVVLPSLAGEGTGHVDMFATFVSAKRVLLGRYDREEDSENALRLDRAAAMLKRAGLEVIRVPMAANEDGVYRTYTNIAVVNNVVLVPVYPVSREHEAEALEIIGRAFPHRRVVAIDATEAIELGGAIHCVVMTSAR